MKRRGFFDSLELILSDTVGTLFPISVTCVMRCVYKEYGSRSYI